MSQLFKKYKKKTALKYHAPWGGSIKKTIRVKWGGVVTPVFANLFFVNMFIFFHGNPYNIIHHSNPLNELYSMKAV